jgi:hypothetical protein
MTTGRRAPILYPKHQHPPTHPLTTQGQHHHQK